MAFKIPTMNDTRDFLLALGKALFPDRNWGNKRSYHARRTSVLAAAVTQLHKHVDSVQRDVMPDTAGDDGPIDRWGNIVGTGRKAATPARKSAAGRVKGSAAATLPIGTQLKHQASGLLFQINSTVVIPGAPPLQFDADILAIDTGAQTRLLAKEILELVTPVAGIETQIVLQRDLDEDGYDKEQFGSYRGRTLTTFSAPTSGGSQADFIAWALQVSGVSTAFAYPNRAGYGTTDVVGLHGATSTSRIMNGGEMTTLLTYLKTKAPAHLAGVPGALRVLTVIADPQNVEIALTPNGDPAFAFDWDDSAGYTALGWTAGTLELQFAGGALPPTLKAGHRLSMKGVASAQDGTEFQISSISAVDKVILAKAPAIAPAATDVIYSGGPLVTPIRSAILAHMNGDAVYAGAGGVPLAASSLLSTVGLQVLADGLGPANPAGIYGTWNGALLRSILGKIVMYKFGVRNFTIPTPAADYEATDDAFPNDTQIHLITPGAVNVRKL